MNEPLQTTLVDAARFLEAEGISYALIGGLAVSFHGQPRTTADVDLVIAADITRSLQLAGILEGTCFRPLFDNVAEVVQSAFILPLRHRSTDVKVDMAMGLSGFEQQVVARAELVKVGDTQVRIATAEDLLIMKTLAGRPQDEQDVRGLVLILRERLDWDYCQRVADQLGEALGEDLGAKVRALRGPR